MQRSELLLITIIIVLSLFYYSVNWSKINHSIRNIRQFITTKSVDDYLLKVSINQPNCYFRKSYIKAAVTTDLKENIIFVDLRGCPNFRPDKQNISLNNRKIDSVDIISDDIYLLFQEDSYIFIIKKNYLDNVTAIINLLG